MKTGLRILPLLALAGCTGSYQYLGGFQAVDGKLYLLSEKVSLNLGSIVWQGGGNGRLAVSKDGGQSWQVLQRGLSGKPVFAGPSCLLFLQGTRLVRSRDGGHNVERLSFETASYPSPFNLRGQIGVISSEGLQLTADCGENWQTVEVEPLRRDDETLSLSAAALEDGKLAVASHLGRVYLRESPQADWKEVILGPVVDLAFHGGKLYALTSMGTLTRIEANGFEHLYTKLKRSPGSFHLCGDELFFFSGGDLFRVNDGAVEKAGSFQADQTARTLSIQADFADASCDQLWVAASQDTETIRVWRLDLRSGEQHIVATVRSLD